MTANISIQYLSSKNGGDVQKLIRTGVPLGIFEDKTWEQEVVSISPGDVLVLYTDGVTDSDDRNGTFFGRKRLMEVAQANHGRSAKDVKDAIITEIHKFVGDAPQFDDITLMVVSPNSDAV